jgi:hypothetical protein
MGEHLSEQSLLNKATPLILEVFQGPDESTPQLSILERDGETSLTMPTEQVWALAVALAHIAEGVRTGSKLDPPGCSPIDLDNPPEYGDCIVTATVAG